MVARLQRRVAVSIQICRRPRGRGEHETGMTLIFHEQRPEIRFPTRAWPRPLNVRPGHFVSTRDAPRGQPARRATAVQPGQWTSRRQLAASTITSPPRRNAKCGHECGPPHGRRRTSGTVRRVRPWVPSCIVNTSQNARKNDLARTFIGVEFGVSQPNETFRRTPRAAFASIAKVGPGTLRSAPACDGPDDHEPGTGQLLGGNSNGLR